MHKLIKYMNRIAVIILLVLFPFLSKAATIGEWNVYPAYADITDIQPAGNTVYVLSSGNLFSYHLHDNSVKTYGKGHGLSDAGITLISWCDQAKKLVVIYDNYNIDFIDQEDNYNNLPDYYQKSTSLDKTINKVVVIDQFAYVCTGFGIMKIDVKKEEISDTYQLNDNIADMTIVDQVIYAVNKDGNKIYQANIHDNLLDPNNWTFFSGNKSDVFTTDENVITLSTANVVVYDKKNKYYWSDDKNGNLQAFSLDENKEPVMILEGIHPDGPQSNYFYFMKVFNNKLYTVPGGWSWADKFFRPGMIQILDENNDWIIYGKDVVPDYGRAFQDVSSIAVDPRDPSHFFVGTGGTGLYEFKDGEKINNFTDGNSDDAIYSTLRTNRINHNYVRADGVVYDADGVLWLVNGYSPNPVISFTPDRKWVTYHPDELMGTDGNGYATLTRTCLDSKRRYWFVNDTGLAPALFCFDTVNKTGKKYTNFKNQDGVNFTIYRVPNVSEDLQGNIWLCTEVGPLMLTEEQINDPSLGFTQIKVPRNDGTNYADYLLNGVFITCMTVDGAGRKWFGTDSKGVYLISEDNNTQIEHFTETNSNLLSNTIESIAVNNKTGEVFFGTSRGLCSYMSDASETAEEMIKDQVYAYPNPVRPDYTGYITITGLTYNADVKILTTNGTLVKEGRSNGGTFVWDGNDQKGKRVASGIYMVNTATQDGKKGTVCKIAIIN